MKKFLISSVTVAAILTTGFLDTIAVNDSDSSLQNVAKASERIVKEYTQSFPQKDEYNTKGKLYDIVYVNSHFPVKYAIVKFTDGSNLKFELKNRPDFNEENEKISKEIKEITYYGEERDVEETIPLEKLDNLDPKSFSEFYDSLFFKSYPKGTKITLILEDGRTISYTYGDSLESTGIDNTERILIKKAIIETP